MPETIIEAIIQEFNFATQIEKCQMGRMWNVNRLTLAPAKQHRITSLLEDLVSDDDEGEGKAASEEQHHSCEQAPFVFHREWQVLKETIHQEHVLLKALILGADIT